MKSQNIILSIALSFVTVTSILMTATVDAAAVRSMSRETQVERDGDTFMVVSVNCSGSSVPRVISRASGRSKWCDKDACYSGKIRAARKACSSRKQDSVAKTSPKNEPSADVKKEPSADVDKKPLAVEDTAAPTAEPAVAKAKLGPNGKTRAELMKEYMQIEEQRIIVEQQKIELNKRELEIQKRELAL